MAGVNTKNEKLAKRIFPQPSVVRGTPKNELFGVDTFFIFRAAAYIAVGTMVLLLSLFFGGNHTRPLLSAALIIFCLSACFGGRMLYIGRERKYFVLALTCINISFPKGYETIGNFLNPVSQTAFQKTQRVTFTDESGNKIVFTFERSRRFLQDRQYAFYFHALRPDEEATIDVLERLKIDHCAISQMIDV